LSRGIVGLRDREDVAAVIDPIVNANLFKRSSQFVLIARVLNGSDDAVA